MSAVLPTARPRRSRPRGVLAPVALLVIVILIAFALVPGLIAPDSPVALNMADRLKPPSFAHLFGTDEGGRDIFSRVVFGTRYSLGVAIAIVFASALFGVVYGAVSGMARGSADNVMMRIVDLFFGFPALVLALAVAASIGRGLGSVALSLTIIWWPGYARLVRGEVLRLRERPHVEAARALGVSNLTILRRHILPFVAQEVNVRVTTDIGYALVAVTALSFLGLGANSPTPEWGLLIRDSRPYFGSAWWYLVFPGTMIMLTATAFSLIGDSLAARRGG
ncbi:peptide/nickel transport system permease protein [Kaistia hirudinis]|uniref:Peptide/nickel transport system permease protein n=1 Tax=Kaistia hirudinis TaxID=1293440 RepID=A0A840AR49_9HYPH|nr:ABC transporter permease [Kaistia hirudinis]MBB3931934.1 peptide/nickel transport system permease protein [Kaistia hirudinis]